MLSTDVRPSHDPSDAAASSWPTRRGSTYTALSRRGLPGPVHASVGMPKGEFAAFVVVVPLLSIPVLLATMGAAWAGGTALVLTAVVGWLCAARRVVVGDGWVADRRLWRYRITHGAELRAVELRETAHGGVLRLSPNAGRAHRVRLTEVSLPLSPGSATSCGREDGARRPGRWWQPRGRHRRETRAGRAHSVAGLRAPDHCTAPRRPTRRGRTDPVRTT